MLQIERFRKEYSDKVILYIEKLHFEEGIHWVKGANGSGKSTLFRCLAGLSPYKGMIRCCGVDLSRSPSNYKLQVNYAQAEPVFPASLTGRQVLEYFASLKQSPKTQQTDLINSIRLDTFLDQSVKSYSSGMAKKLALALAFLGQPKLVLLDEPFNALDATSREGCSFLLSTHHDFGSELNLKTKNWLVKNQTVTEE